MAEWAEAEKAPALSCFQPEKNDIINITSILNAWNYLVIQLQPLKNYLFVPAKERSAFLNHP
jgi:hypothetical protein